MLHLTFDKFIFFANSSSQTFTKDYNLMVTDGTPSGTSTLKTFQVSQEFPPYFDGNLTRINDNQALFIADDSIHGEELWVTDGTVAGTTLLKDINAGTAGSNPDIGPSVDDKIFFKAGIKDKSHTLWQLWITDGTSMGTILLSDSTDYDGFASLNSSTVLNNVLIFYTYNAPKGKYALWRSDGTIAGTFQIQNLGKNAFDNVAHVPKMITYNSKVIFAGYGSNHGNEPWITDGTAAGTKMIKDIAAGSSGSLPAQFTAYNNNIYFIAQQPPSLLWMTDGTSAGTQQVTGSFSSATTIQGIAGNYLYFGAIPASDNQAQEWRTDGTTSGTLQLTTVSAGLKITDSAEFLNINGAAYFVDAHPQGISFTLPWSLYRSDGTVSGTTDLLDDTKKQTSPTIFNLTNLSGTLFFVASHYQNDQAIHSYDKKHGIQDYDFFPGRNDEAVILDTSVNSLFLSLNGTSVGSEPYILLLTTPESKLFSEEATFSVFPNPTTGHFMLNIQQPEAAKISLAVLDVFGRIVMQKDLTSQYSFIQLPEELTDGTYLLKISDGDKSYQKFIELSR
jgi:ELWxxDGT repeat protein